MSDTEKRVREFLLAAAHVAAEFDATSAQLERRQPPGDLANARAVLAWILSRVHDWPHRVIARSLATTPDRVANVLTSVDRFVSLKTSNEMRDRLSTVLAKMHASSVRRLYRMIDATQLDAPREVDSDELHRALVEALPSNEDAGGFVQ